MTDKKLDQQTGNVGDQAKPQTEGISPPPQSGELSTEQLDTVSGGVGLVGIAPLTSAHPTTNVVAPPPPSI